MFDEDLLAIVHDELQSVEESCQLEYLHINSGTSSIPTATVRLRVNGVAKEAACIGDGPIDAVYKALATITNSASKLLRYDIRSVTSGTEAMGEAIVHLQQDDVKVVGRGVSTDIIEASARAYVDGLNKLASRSRTTQPQTTA